MEPKIIQTQKKPNSLKYSFFLAVGMLKKITFLGLLILFFSHLISAQPLLNENKITEPQNQYGEYSMQIESYYQNGIVYMNWVENVFNQKTYQNAIWVSNKNGDYLSLEISKDNKEFLLLGRIPLNKLSNQITLQSKDGIYYNGIVFFKYSLLDSMNKILAEKSVAVQMRGQKELYGFYKNYENHNLTDNVNK